MGRGSATSLGRIALALVVAAACSEGAPGSSFPGLPPSPVPNTSDDGRATEGQDTDGGAGDCCVANGSPGCNDVGVEACVCAEMASCCADGWTADCAAAVDDLACGQCAGGPNDTGDVDPDDTGQPPNGQDCCSGGPLPGCNDPEVQACVCSELDFCCTDGWEKVCGSAVEALGCGHCGGIDETTGEPPPPPPGGTTTGEPPPPPGGTGDCCAANGTPGCDDAATESCVCMEDPYCCDTDWDDVCVGEVDSLGCGTCGGAMPPGVSPCCMAQAGPGCGDAAIEACVCLIDDYCCTTEWDAACSVFVDLFFCADCTP